MHHYLLKMYLLNDTSVKKKKSLAVNNLVLREKISFVKSKFKDVLLSEKDSH